MATIKKVCNCCGKSLDATTEFYHRNKNTSDGLLGHCKTCQNEKTAEYRVGKGKDYWYDDKGGGWFRDPNNKPKWLEYLKENYSARFNCKIYAIVNPEGLVYIGHTKHPTIQRRLSNHKNDYNQFKKGNKRTQIPGLWASVDKWGWCNHTAILIEELDTDNKKVGLERESFYIEQFMRQGKSLNVKS